MQTILRSLLALLLLSVSVRAEWPGVEYKTVKVFLYHLQDGPQDEGVEDPIVMTGRLHSTVFNSGGATLTEEQVSRLNIAINKTQNVPTPAMCYMPHHGFVYFDKNGKPVASFSICFFCSTYQFSPKRKTHELDIDTLKKLVVEAKLPVFSKDEDIVEYVKQHAPKAADKPADEKAAKKEAVPAKPAVRKRSN